ncbi:MAG TPA: HAD family hydrolase [Thermoanaerobaculia bacterium]|nr:HAD family hydrolase [Thermoanaerobaculia bacterium]
MANETNGSPYRGVILDVDGTLLDSNAAHVEAWVEALNENGFAVTADDIWPLVGMGGDNLLPAAVGIDKESPEGKKISERRGEIYKSRLPHLEAFPGVRDLLTRMREDGLKLVVATSSPKEEVDQALEIVRVTDLIEETVSASDAGKSKPDPHTVATAVERSGLLPGELVMLGDTPYDVEAAGKAGVKTIALRSGNFPDDKLRNALAIYDDAADLLARYDASPLGGSGR